MKRAIILLLLCAAAALAQQRGTYWIEQETTLAGGTEAVTVHMPAGSGRSARFIGATVYCAAECVFVIERDGSAPTSTAVTPVKTNRSDQAVTAAAYRASNVGAGRILPKNYVHAGTTFTVGLEDNEILDGDNLTVRTNAVVGVVKIMITWREY